MKNSPASARGSLAAKLHTELAHYGPLLFVIETATRCHESRFRCKNCRRTLFSSSHVVSSHGESWSVHVGFTCPISKIDTIWYVRGENLHDWLLEQLDNVKGKLYCPGCSARLGSFDFATDAKCDCDEFVLPSIHISKSCIDCEQTHKVASILQHIVKPPDSVLLSHTDKPGAS